MQALYSGTEANLKFTDSCNAIFEIFFVFLQTIILFLNDVRTTLIKVQHAY